MVDTACTSGLVALSVAAEALERGSCEAAIAASANLILSASLFNHFDRALSPDSRCKSFDASANGYCRSEAAVALFLTNSSANSVFSVGCFSISRSNQGGLPPPDSEKLAALMNSSWTKAKAQFGEVQYLEAHGSGSNAGDVAEFHALERVFEQKSPILVSSVKTRVGHTEAVSGLMALVHLAATFRHNVLSPHLHFRQLNPRIGNSSKLVIPVESVAVSNSFANISVSNRGFSGTNVHLMVKRGNAASKEKKLFFVFSLKKPFKSSHDFHPAEF